MQSLFYRARFERPVSVSFMLIERVAALLRNDKEAAEKDPDYVTACIMQAIIDISSENVSQEQLDYVMKRLMALTKEAEESKPEAKKGKQKDGFATSYVAWAESLDPAGVCLVATGHDFAAAKLLYEDEDREDVLDLAERRLKQDWEAIKVGFESSAYAFGGGYKDDNGSDPDSNVIDLTKDTATTRAHLKKFGF